jgi:radical SAM superfamily enzyme YgiQ (UPF0313 family)
VRRDLEDLASRGLRRILFVDDNPCLDRSHFRGLLEILRDLKITWSANSTADVLQNEALLDEMAAAGCESLSIGFESLDARNLKGVGKGQLDPGSYAAGIQRLRQRGIHAVAMFVLGLDHDSEAVFDRVFHFLEENRVGMALFHVLVPIQGTPLFEKLQAEKRLDASALNEHGPNQAGFTPAAMSREALDAGFWELNERFYSIGSILRRLVLVRPDRHYLRRLPMVVANLYIRHLVRSRQLFI